MPRRSPARAASQRTLPVCRLCHAARFVAGFVAGALAAAALGQDFNRDGFPDLIWREKTTGENWVWLMNGTQFQRGVQLPSITETAWKLAGLGDFNHDGLRTDLLWQHLGTGELAVWFMEGTTRIRESGILPEFDPGWKVVGVADLNRDGHADIIWQHDTTGQKAVWTMNGVERVSGAIINDSSGVLWRVAATGDMNNDGQPDIVLRHLQTGQLAIWIMNGLTVASGLVSSAVEVDQDWQIVGTGDFNGDGRADLLWRHATLGLNLVWYMDGANFVGSAFLRPIHDLDWRLATQSISNSTWRIDRERARSGSVLLTAATDSGSPTVTLRFRFPPFEGNGMSVDRQTFSAEIWQNLVNNLNADTYTDTVAAGERYQYRVFREPFQGSSFSSSEFIAAAYRARPIENRGRVLLLVDETLESSLEPRLQRLRRDLVGDGWTVTQYGVPRHDDSAWEPNPAKIEQIRSLIVSEFESPQSVAAVFLLGHVAIPYSGFLATDGHFLCPQNPGDNADHRGAWPADVYYADVNPEGEWTDQFSIQNCSSSLNANLPNDGKFDQDFFPANSQMRVAVGRVDFARLPTLTQNPPAGIPPVSELDLIRRYLDKEHAYRHRQLPWQREPHDQMIVAGHFLLTRTDPSFDTSIPIFRNAVRNADALFGENSDRLVCGDFFFDRKRSYLWGFLGGPGSWDQVKWNHFYGGGAQNHTTADLADPAKEPHVAFYTILGSFLGDWNTGSDNFLRALLATPNYGLASMWTRSTIWRIDPLALGEHLGMALVRKMNNPSDLIFPRERIRDLAILGDPTLRIHILPPPLELTAFPGSNRIQLRWIEAVPGGKYFVYRSSSADGPFERISPHPVTSPVFNDLAPPTGSKTYLVRALELQTSSHGSYTNLSQGAFVSLE